MTEREHPTAGAPDSPHGADPVEKAKELAGGAAHGVAHPVETAKALEHEAEVGQSARTPLIVLSAVTVGVGAVLAIVLAISLTLYFVYGGR